MIDVENFFGEGVLAGVHQHFEQQQRAQQQQQAGALETHILVTTWLEVAFPKKVEQMNLYRLTWTRRFAELSASHKANIDRIEGEAKALIANKNSSVFTVNGRQTCLWSPKELIFFLQTIYVDIETIDNTGVRFSQKPYLRNASIFLCRLHLAKIRQEGAVDHNLSPAEYEAEAKRLWSFARGSRAETNKKHHIKKKQELTGLRDANAQLAGQNFVARATNQQLQADNERLLLTVRREREAHNNNIVVPPNNADNNNANNAGNVRGGRGRGGGGGVGRGGVAVVAGAGGSDDDQSNDDLSSDGEEEEEVEPDEEEDEDEDQDEPVRGGRGGGRAGGRGGVRGGRGGGRGGRGGGRGR